MKLYACKDYYLGSALCSLDCPLAATGFSGAASVDSEPGAVANSPSEPSRPTIIASTAFSAASFSIYFLSFYFSSISLICLVCASRLAFYSGVSYLGIAVSSSWAAVSSPPPYASCPGAATFGAAKNVSMLMMFLRKPH